VKRSCSQLGQRYSVVAGGNAPAHLHGGCPATRTCLSAKFKAGIDLSFFAAGAAAGIAPDVVSGTLSAPGLGASADVDPQETQRDPLGRISLQPTQNLEEGRGPPVG
jgi:hypothetical protein